MSGEEQLVKARLTGRFKYGRGIYTSPDPAVAEAYTGAFSHGGKRYKVLLQNRVDEAETEEVHGGRYFLTRREEAIRPYGILFKEIQE